MKRNTLRRYVCIRKNPEERLRKVVYLCDVLGMLGRSRPSRSWYRKVHMTAKLTKCLCTVYCFNNLLISFLQVMVCVYHGHYRSNLYVSSVPRSTQHQVRFSLSLERILYFKPSSNWNGTWLRYVQLLIRNRIVNVQNIDVFCCARLDLCD